MTVHNYFFLRPNKLPLCDNSSGRFWIALLLIFLLRGLAIQCIYPPLEGPDEYQHLAYLQFLLEEKKLPIYGEANVPKSMYNDLTANPHSLHGWNQTKQIGCLPYESYYDSTAVLSIAPNIALYQAQHPPLYYLTVLPIYALTSRHFGFQSAIYWLRAVNIIFGSVGILLLLSPLSHIIKEEKLKNATAIAAVLSPISLIFVSRVSNDSLALLFAGITVWLLSNLSKEKQSDKQVLLAGGCIGLGLITKLTVLPVLLSAYLFLVLFLFFRHNKPAKVIRTITIFSAGAALLSAPLWIYSYSTYGVIIPSQETILNASRGHSLSELLFRSAATMSFDNLVFAAKFIGSTLWSSGWTFLLPHSVFLVAYAIILILGAVGAGILIKSVSARNFHQNIAQNLHLLLCILIILTTAGLIYGHALNTRIAYGYIASPVYYVLIAYPAVMICLSKALKAYTTRLATLMMWLVGGLFMVTELHSLFTVAIPHWSATDNMSLAMQRLTMVHPAFPTPIWSIPIYALALVILVRIAVKERPWRSV